MAREIRMLMECELFGNWRTDVRSQTEVGRVIDPGRHNLTERLARCDVRTARQRHAADERGGKLKRLA